MSCRSATGIGIVNTSVNDCQRGKNAASGAVADIALKRPSAPIAFLVLALA